MSYVHHTILIVDGNVDQAHFIKLALQKVGVITPVQVVADGAEAVRYLAGEGVYLDRESYPIPVLLLLDLTPPADAGVRFLSWLRAQPVLGRLPVIAVSEPAPIAELNRAYELGCNSYLIKPTSFNTLLVMMQGVVQYWLDLNAGPDVGTATGYGARLPLQGVAGESRPEPGA